MTGRIIRFDRRRFRWRGVGPRPYRTAGGGAWQDVQRFVLVGDGESTAFHLRYFELAAGGFSSFEQHDHAHAVLVIRGRGRVRLGARSYRVGPMDFVYVPPGVPHQFRAGKEPFGFLCPVDAVRDRPRPAPARLRPARRAGRIPSPRH